jgi:hypothetical protein
MGNKINIDIRDNIEPGLALRLVTRVIDSGKISKGENGKMYYCWLTVFDTADGEILVSTIQYRKTDCFVVHK